MIDRFGAPGLGDDQSAEKSVDSLETEETENAVINQQAQPINRISSGASIMPTDVSDEASLNTAIANSSGPTEIQLSSDSTANSYINIKIGKNITLALAGHTLTRGLTAATANGYVIKVSGTLTLKDTSANETGKITGGKNTNGGVGVDVLGGSIMQTNPDGIVKCSEDDVEPTGTPHLYYNKNGEKLTGWQEIEI